MNQHQLVLITGANSFYAAAIIGRLPKNIKFHAAVRAEKAKAYLEKIHGDRVTVFLTPDITKADAFNEAVKGCDAIFHVASPFQYKFDNARTGFLDPAIDGALSALKAASSESKVTRVVFTSSIAACLDPREWYRPGYTYTEADWNPLTYDEAADNGTFKYVYTGSKGLAEQAALNYMKSETRHFDMVCINPCHTWGHYDQQLTSRGAMNLTNADLSKLMDGANKDGLPPTIMPWMTDIDDVAQAHVNALLKKEASGRYIVANSPYDFQTVVDVMREEFAGADWIENLPKGTPGQKSVGEHFVLDNSRSRKELGVEYKPWKQSVIEFCKKYEEDRRSIP